MKQRHKEMSLASLAIDLDAVEQRLEAVEAALVAVEEHGEHEKPKKSTAHHK
jgi:hypothetical protein